MMNGGNTIMFSKGIQMTNNNGQINKKEYHAMYEKASVDRSGH